MPGGVCSEQVKATRAEVRCDSATTIPTLEKAPRPCKLSHDLVLQHDRDSAIQQSPRNKGIKCEKEILRVSWREYWGYICSSLSNLLSRMQGISGMSLQCGP